MTERSAAMQRYEPGDIVQDARQVSYVAKNEQMGLFE